MLSTCWRAAPADSETHDQVVQDLMRILEAQRIISLDTLFQLADHIEAIAKGEKLDPALVNRLAGRIAKFSCRAPRLSANEKNAMGFGYWTERHIEAERKLNLRAAIEKAAGDPEKVKDMRGLLAPLLRDTLLAFNYAHYAPPGAQILYTNPVFVRSHDFLGMQGTDHTWRPTETVRHRLAFERRRTPGGLALRAALRAGRSRTELPDSHADPGADLGRPGAADDPEREDSALVERDSRADPLGRRCTCATAENCWRKRRWIREVRDAGARRRSAMLRRPGAHAAGGAAAGTGRREGRARARDAVGAVPAGARDWRRAQIREFAACWPRFDAHGRDSPEEVNYAAISRAFGTPKPTLANSYEPELLNLRTFPTLMGYSSRIMAESWESNTLYWAALADELQRVAHAVERAHSGVDAANWWSRSSPRTWKTGRRC